MSYEHFQKILLKMPYLKKIAFFFMGEPLLNAETFKMIELCSKKGIATVVNTNCTTLKSDYKKIVDCGLNKVNLSLDGFSHESINSYRKGSNFDEIIEGIEKLVKYREMQNSKLWITMRTLVFKKTEAEIPLIEDFSRTIGIDELVLVTPILDGWGGKVNQDKEMIKPSEKWIRVSETRAKPPAPCPSVRKIVISWDGMMLPCCHDVHGEYSYGNIFEKSLDETYWSPDGRKLREKVVGCELPICWGCERALPEEKKVVLYNAKLEQDTRGYEIYKAPLPQFRARTYK
jgi:radical SAM protein with 4Fe4S-binding SPASM domain